MRRIGLVRACVCMGLKPTSVEISRPKVTTVNSSSFTILQVAYLIKPDLLLIGRCIFTKSWYLSAHNLKPKENHAIHKKVFFAGC